MPSADRKQHDGLPNGPPLDAIIRRLRGVPVYPLAHHDVLLLVLDGLQSLNKVADFFFQRRHVLIVGDVEHAVDVKAGRLNVRISTGDIRVIVGYMPDYLVRNRAHYIGEAIFIAAVFLRGYCRCTSRLPVLF